VTGPVAEHVTPHAAGRDHRRVAWWWAGASLSAVTVLVGLAEPSAALAGALLVAITVSGGVAVGTAVALFRRLEAQPRSEFAPTPQRHVAQLLPHHIARILPDHDDKHPALTSGARAGIVTVATERLWARHGLNLHDPTHHQQVQHLVTPDLWETIRPDRVDQRGTIVPRARVLHRDLDRLLDDLESI
jgi:hypothetical protein